MYICMCVCLCVCINHARAGWGFRGHLPYFPKENLKPRKVKRLAQGHSVSGRIGQCLNSGFFLLFQVAFPLLALTCSSPWRGENYWQNYLACNLLIMQCWALCKKLHKPDLYILIIQTTVPREIRRETSRQKSF